MSIDRPGIPPEVQRQADEAAEDLWASIEKDARRADVAPVQLERLKPMVQQALRIAFGRGALISVKEGFKQLQKMAARTPKRPMQ
jgi:hypothetical protein